jgi:5'-nucleotidase
MRRAPVTILTAVAALALATPGAHADPPPAAEPQSQRTVEVQVLGLNETHGQLVPLRRDGRLAGGAATLAAYLEREEAENPRRTLILDSGDFMQGPPISSFFEGASTVEVFNAIGVDAVAVGNHEFDWGQDALRARIGEADFPFLAVNIRDAETGQQPEGIEPYVVERLGGVKVGVIGVANPDTKNVTLPAATEGLEFLDLSASAQAVNDAVAALRRRGVETIVVSVHQGLSAPGEGALADLVSGLSREVDLVLGGHIALEFNTEINGIPVVQPYGNTRGYGDAVLTVDRKTRDVVATEVQTDATWVDAIEPDSEAAAIVERYQAQLREALGKVVGETRTEITRTGAESEMGNFVTDAMRSHVAGVDFAFTNAGGLRADIDAGPITLEEIYTVLPFNNTLVLMDLTGEQVRRVLEEGAASRYGVVQVSGLRWAFDADAPFGSRVTRVTLPNGTPIEPGATYRIATNNFMASGGDQFTTLTQGGNVVDTGVNLVDTVVELLARSSPVDPQVEGRLTIE